MCRCIRFHTANPMKKENWDGITENRRFWRLCQFTCTCSMRRVAQLLSCIPQERGSDHPTSERALSGVIMGRTPPIPRNSEKKSQSLDQNYGPLRLCGMDSAQFSDLKPRVAPPGKILTHSKKNNLRPKSGLKT